MTFAGDSSRRKFFKRAGVAAGSALLTANQIWAAEHGENLPPNIPSWMQQVGTGVGAAPYGSRHAFAAPCIRGPESMCGIHVIAPWHYSQTTSTAKSDAMRGSHSHRSRHRRGSSHSEPAQ